MKKISKQQMKSFQNAHEFEDKKQQELALEVGKYSTTIVRMYNAIKRMGDKEIQSIDDFKSYLTYMHMQPKTDMVAIPTEYANHKPSELFLNEFDSYVKSAKSYIIPKLKNSSDYSQYADDVKTFVNGFSQLPLKVITEDDVDEAYSLYNVFNKAYMDTVLKTK